MHYYSIFSIYKQNYLGKQACVFDCLLLDLLFYFFLFQESEKVNTKKIQNVADTGKYGKIYSNASTSKQERKCKKGIVLAYLLM
jgi:hypothetical protein